MNLKFEATRAGLGKEVTVGSSLLRVRAVHRSLHGRFFFCSLSESSVCEMGRLLEFEPTGLLSEMDIRGNSCRFVLALRLQVASRAAPW